VSPSFSVTGIQGSRSLSRSRRSSSKCPPHTGSQNPPARGNRSLDSRRTGRSPLRQGNSSPRNCNRRRKTGRVHPQCSSGPPPERGFAAGMLRSCMCPGTSRHHSRKDCPQDRSRLAESRLGSPSTLHAHALRELSPRPSRQLDLTAPRQGSIASLASVAGRCQAPGGGQK
jgi:hypothetical protein